MAPAVSSQAKSPAILGLALAFHLAGRVIGGPPTPAPEAPGRAAVLQRDFDAAFVAWRSAEPSHTNSLAIVHDLCRLSYDLASIQPDHEPRARITQVGIAAAEASLLSHPTSARTHYYLALNLGELARTKNVGALRLLPRIRDSLEAARKLDESIDHGGPDRTLGLLYLEAPGWPASIGSRAKARAHFLRAIALAPEYPSNHLCLAEALLRWREAAAAAARLASLDALWPNAQARWAEARWAADWTEWTRRREALRTALAGGKP